MADEPTQSGSASVLDLTALGIDFGSMLSGVLNPVTSTSTGETKQSADASSLPSISVPLPIVGNIGIIGSDDQTNLIGITNFNNLVDLQPGGLSEVTSALSGLSINVGQLLGQVPGLSAVFSDLQIKTDSIGTTTEDDGSDTTGSTTLSGASLYAESPIVGAITGATSSITGAIQPLIDTLTSALGALGPLGAPRIEVNLDEAVEALLQEPFGPFGGITINPKDGSLDFDLDTLLPGILNPGPNTQLLSESNIDDIADALALAMDSFAKSLVDKLTDVLADSVRVYFEPTAVGGLKGDVSLGQLLGLDDTPMTLTGCGPTLPFIGQTCVLPVGPILDVATAPLEAAADMLPKVVQTAVDAVVKPVVNVVSPALDLVNQVVDVTLNKQTTNDDGSTTTTGLSVSLLGGSVATLGLGNTTLSAAREPVVNATTPVQAGGTTDVTGSLFTPGEEVTVTLVCDGETVDSATVNASTAAVSNSDGTTTPAGSISAPLTVPAGPPAPSSCEAVVDAPEGTYSTPVTVIPPPELKQPDPLSPGGSPTTTTGTGFTPGSTPTFDITGPCTVTANGPADANGTVTVSVSATGVDPATCTVTAKDGATGAPADPVTVTVLDPSRPYIWWTNTAGETVQYVRYGDVAVLNGKQFSTGGTSSDRGQVGMQIGSSYVSGATDMIIGLENAESSDGRAIVQTGVRGTLTPIEFDTDNDPVNSDPVADFLTLPVGPYTARAYSYPADVASNDATFTVFPSVQDITVPAEVPSGATTVPITGTGFASGEPVTVTTVCHVENDDGTTTDVTTTSQAIAGPPTDVDAGGDISANISVPASVPAGTICDVTATGVGSGATAGPDSFTVTDPPTIDVPTAVGVDDPIIPISGEKFPADTPVTVVVTDPSGNPVTCVPALDSVTTDGSGNIPEGTQCVLPDSSTPGVYTVTVTEPDGAKATDTVQVVDPQVDPVTPDEIPVTGTVTANGTGFTPGGDVTVTLTAPDGSTIICPPDRTALDPTDATFKADASGNISVPCEIPENTSGDNVIYTATITDNSSGVSVDGGQVTVTPPPTITVQSPVPGQPFPDTDGDGEPDPSVPAGGSITVSCDDKFAAGETVTVNVYATNTDGTPKADTVIGTGTCTPDGIAKITVPSGTATGDYTIIATGDDSGATATSPLKVNPVPTVEAGTPNPDASKPGVATAGTGVPIRDSSGFTPGGTVTVSVDGMIDTDNDPGTPPVAVHLCTAQTTAEEDGTLPIPLDPACTIPATATAGTYTVTATDITGAKGTDTITVTNPTLLPLPTLPAGSNPTVYGTGFVPGEEVAVSVTCTGIPSGPFPGTAVATAGGSIAVPIVNKSDDIPAPDGDGVDDGLPQGTCTATATGTVTTTPETTTFTVGDGPTINVVPETTGPGAVLPVTGEHYTANTLAVIQLTNDNGTPDNPDDDFTVGDPIFVQIGDDGKIPSDTTYTIPSTYQKCTDKNDPTSCTELPTPAGDYHLVGVDRWGAVATDQVSITTIEPDPAKPVVPAGQSITVTGTGYTPGGEVPVNVTATVPNPDGLPEDPDDDTMVVTYPCFAPGTVEPEVDAEGNETGEFTGDPVVATTAADTSVNPPIPAGSVTATCPIPFDAPAGDYSTTTTVTNTNGTEDTTDDFDDTITSENTFEVATPPFLLVNGQTTPTSAVPPAAAGDQVPVTAMGIPSTTTGVRITATPAGGGDPVPCTPDPAAPDPYREVVVTCPVPADAVPGEWTIAATDSATGLAIPNSDNTGPLTETIQIANPTVEITDPATGNPFPDEDSDGVPDDATIPAGGTLEIDGTGYAPGETVTIQVLDGDNPVGDPITACADANGDLGTPGTAVDDKGTEDTSDDETVATCTAGPIEYPIPADTDPGEYTVVTTGEESGGTTETPLTVTEPPALADIPAIPPTGSVPVTGQDFTPGGVVVVTVTNDNGTPDDPSDDTVLGPVTVTACAEGETGCGEPGDITVKVPVPTTVEKCSDPADATTCSQVPTPPGTYTVTATDPSGAEATTPVEILEAPPEVDAPPPPPPRARPSTFPSPASPRTRRCASRSRRRTTRRPPPSRCARAPTTRARRRCPTCPSPTAPTRASTSSPRLAPRRKRPPPTRSTSRTRPSPSRR